MSWIRAHRNRDIRAARAAGKDLRHIVTRLDQFTRDKERASEHLERDKRANDTNSKTQERRDSHGLAQVGDIARRAITREGDGEENKTNDAPLAVAGGTKD